MTTGCEYSLPQQHQSFSLAISRHRTGIDLADATISTEHSFKRNPSPRARRARPGAYDQANHVMFTYSHDYLGDCLTSFVSCRLIPVDYNASRLQAGDLTVFQNVVHSPSPLNVRTDTVFTPQRLGSRVGCLEVSLSITNTSEIVAVAPFIAFSALGLKWVASKDWIEEYYDKRPGLKMRRFSSRTNRALKANESVLPCILKIPVTMDNRCSLVILPGQEKAIADLPDLVLYYIVGAGNFAPQRSSVVVAATMIRSQVYSAFPWVTPKSSAIQAGSRQIPDTRM